jgi:hypothetical protein
VPDAWGRLSFFFLCPQAYVGARSGALMAPRPVFCVLGPPPPRSTRRDAILGVMRWRRSCWGSAVRSFTPGLTRADRLKESPDLPNLGSHGPACCQALARPETMFEIAVVITPGPA